MGVNGKILKFAMSWKWLAVEWNEWKFGLAVPGTPYVGYFSGQVIWVQFGVSRCKISDVKIFKRLQPNFMESMVIKGEYRPLLVLGICRKLIFWHFEIFVNTGLYVGEHFKTLLILQFSPNVNQNSWRHWQPWGNSGFYFLWQSAKF